MIDIKNLHVERNGATLCQVDELSVETGERLATVGANGSGKTTLLRILAGLEPDYAGDCRVAVNHQQRTYLHQQPFLFRGTVAANVRYGEKDGAGQGGSGFDWLGRLQLGHLADRSVANLSGGERRRVEIARCLASDPKYVLLDEPFAGVDPIAVGEIRHLVADLKSRGIGVLITDHNVRETLEIVDRAYILHEGKVLMSGTPADVVQNENVRRVYLGDNFRIS